MSICYPYTHNPFHIHSHTHLHIHSLYLSCIHHTFIPLPKKLPCHPFLSNEFEGHFRDKILRYLPKGKVLKLGLTLITLSNNKPLLVLDLDFKSSKPTQRQRVFSQPTQSKGNGGSQWAYIT